MAAAQAQLLPPGEWQIPGVFGEQQQQQQEYSLQQQEQQQHHESTWALLMSALLYKHQPAASDGGDATSSFQPDWPNCLLALVLIMLMLTTAVGNLFVIVAILIERNLRTIGNYLVLSLAIADLLVACLVMPLAGIYQILDRWTLGVLLCDIWTSADVFCCTASILHLLAIALDRYWAVTRVDYIRCQRNERRILAIIGFVWMAALVISLAPVFGWKDDQFEWRITVQLECLISQDIGYQIFATCTTFYFPLTLTLIFYWKIYQVARKRIRRKLDSRAKVALRHPSSSSSGVSLPSSKLAPNTTATAVVGGGGKLVDSKQHRQRAASPAALQALRDQIVNKAAKCQLIAKYTPKAAQRATSALERTRDAGQQPAEVLVASAGGGQLCTCACHRGPVSSESVAVGAASNVALVTQDNKSGARPNMSSATGKLASENLAGDRANGQSSLPLPQAQNTAVHMRRSPANRSLAATTAAAAAAANGVPHAIGQKLISLNASNANSRQTSLTKCTSTSAPLGRTSSCSAPPPPTPQQQQQQQQQHEDCALRGTPAPLRQQSNLDSHSAVAGETATEQVVHEPVRCKPRGPHRRLSLQECAVLPCSGAKCRRACWPLKASQSQASGGATGAASNQQSRQLDAHLESEERRTTRQRQQQQAKMVINDLNSTSQLSSTISESDNDDSCGFQSNVSSSFLNNNHLQLFDDDDDDDECCACCCGGAEQANSETGLPPKTPESCARFNSELLVAATSGTAHRSKETASLGACAALESDAPLVDHKQQQQQQSRLTMEADGRVYCDIVRPIEASTTLSQSQPLSPHESQPPAHASQNNHHTNGELAHHHHEQQQRQRQPQSSLPQQLFALQAALCWRRLKAHLLRRHSARSKQQQHHHHQQPPNGRLLQLASATEEDSRQEHEQSRRMDLRPPPVGSTARGAASAEEGQSSLALSYETWPCESRRQPVIVGSVCRNCQCGREPQQPLALNKTEQWNRRKSQRRLEEEEHCATDEDSGAPTRAGLVVAAASTANIAVSTTAARSGRYNKQQQQNHSIGGGHGTLAGSQSMTVEGVESKRERKAAKTLAIITGVFVMCWLPFFIMAILMPLLELRPHKYLFAFLLWLGYANSMLNPIIYTIFSPDFRKAFNRLLCNEKLLDNSPDKTRNRARANNWQDQNTTSTGVRCFACLCHQIRRLHPRVARLLETCCLCGKGRDQQGDWLSDSNSSHVKLGGPGRTSQEARRLGGARGVGSSNVTGAAAVHTVATSQPMFAAAATTANRDDKPMAAMVAPAVAPWSLGGCRQQETVPNSAEGSHWTLNTSAGGSPRTIPSSGNTPSRSNNTTITLATTATESPQTASSSPAKTASSARRPTIIRPASSITNDF